MFFLFFILKMNNKGCWKKNLLFKFNAFLKTNPQLKIAEKKILITFWSSYTSLWSNIKYILLRYLGLNFQKFSNINEKIFYKQNNKKKISFFKVLEHFLNNELYTYFFLKNLYKPFLKDEFSEISVNFLKEIFTYFFKDILIQKNYYSEKELEKKTFFYKKSSSKKLEIQNNLKSLNLKILDLRLLLQNNLKLISYYIKKFFKSI